MMFFRNTLFFRGCLLDQKYPEVSRTWLRILRTLGVTVITIPEEPCCGSPLRGAGAMDEFQENAQYVRSVFRRYGVGNIITACPSCAFTLGGIWNGRVEHVCKYIVGRLEKKRLKMYKKRVVIHDPCHLSRYLGDSESIRKIINLCGCTVREPPFSKESTYCCGGGGGLPANYPDVALNIARERVRQLEAADVDLIVTACPMCMHMLSKYARIPVVDVSYVISYALGVNK